MQAGTPTPTPTPEAAGRTALAGLFPDWLLFPGWELLAALVVVAIGVFLSKYVVRLLGRPVARRFRRQSVAQTVLRGIRVGTVVLATMFAASILGFQIGDLVLSVTVFSAVLGIVLAPIVGSIISGLFVLADQPYEIGDLVELDDGTRGFVEDITIRYTKLLTLDNTFLVITNSTIRERVVTNFSGEDERTRRSLTIQVTYESDVAEARALIERAASKVDEVIEGGPDIRIGSARYPAKPTCYIDAYADSAVNLTLRYWVERPYRLLTVRSKVQTAVREQLADADVEIAYPHRHHVFDETSGEAQVLLGEGPPGRDETVSPVDADSAVGADDRRPDDGADQPRPDDDADGPRPDDGTDN